MPRPLRIEYAGACYHLISRGDRREEIFRDDSDRKRFLEVLGKACAKNGWQVHAYCLMSNHFHAVVETPQPNLDAARIGAWLCGRSAEIAIFQEGATSKRSCRATSWKT